MFIFADEECARAARENWGSSPPVVARAGASWVGASGRTRVVCGPVRRASAPTPTLSHHPQHVPRPPIICDYYIYDKVLDPCFFWVSFFSLFFFRRQGKTL